MIAGDIWIHLDPTPETYMCWSLNSHDSTLQAYGSFLTEQSDAPREPKLSRSCGTQWTWRAKGPWCGLTDSPILGIGWRAGNLRVLVCARILPVARSISHKPLPLPARVEATTSKDFTLLCTQGWTAMIGLIIAMVVPWRERCGTRVVQRHFAQGHGEILCFTFARPTQTGKKILTTGSSGVRRKDGWKGV